MNEQIRSALGPMASGMRRNQAYVQPISQVVLELPGGDDAFKRAQNFILRWMKPRARVDLPTEAWDGRTFHLDETGAQPTEAIALEQPRYWAARLKDADKTVAQRDWTTEIGLGAHSPTLTMLGVRLTASGMGEDREFRRSVPRLVREIISDIGARVDGVPVDVFPRIISTDGDVDDLVRLIENPQRRCDVIVFSLPDGSADPSGVICNAQGVQRSLVGAAHVVIITGPASFVLTDIMGKEWSVFRQAIRTYRPRFNREQDDLRHHPLTLPVRISGWSGGSQAYEAFLVEQSLMRSVARGDLDNAVPSFLAVRQVAAQLAIQEARQGGSSDADLARLYADESDSLREQLDKQKSETDALLEAAQTEIDALKEELDIQKARLRAQASRIEFLAQSKTTTAHPESIPSDLDDVQAWCEANLGGAVSIMSRAYRGLKDSEFEDVGLIYRSLLMLRDAYVPMKRHGGQAMMEVFHKACGELGLTEEPTGSRTRAGEEGDEYFIRIRGRRRYLDRHLKKGASREARLCFRLYFTWDDEDEQVVVGWLPSHLDTRIS